MFYCRLIFSDWYVSTYFVNIIVKNQIKNICSESVTKNTHRCYGTYCERCIVDKAIDTLLYVVFCVPLFLARSLEYSFQSVVREIVLFHTTHISSPSLYLLHRVSNLSFIASHQLYSFTFHPTLDRTIQQQALLSLATLLICIIKLNY